MIRYYDGPGWGFASRNFYAEFLAALDIDRNPDAYFGRLPQEAVPATRTVTLDRPIDIFTAAQLARTDRYAIADMNPALLDPVVSGRVSIPAGLRAPLAGGRRGRIPGSARAVRARHPGRARRARRPAGSRGERSARRPGRHARRGDAPGEAGTDAHRDCRAIRGERPGAAARQPARSPRPGALGPGPADPRLLRRRASHIPARSWPGGLLVASRCACEPTRCSCASKDVSASPWAATASSRTRSRPAAVRVRRSPSSRPISRRACARSRRRVPFAGTHRDYRTGDLRGATLAYASTHDPATITALREEATRERVLLNVIDVPEACSFLAPAVVNAGRPPGRHRHRGRQPVPRGAPAARDRAHRRVRSTRPSSPSSAPCGTRAAADPARAAVLAVAPRLAAPRAAAPGRSSGSRSLARTHRRGGLHARSARRRGPG